MYCIYSAMLEPASRYPSSVGVPTTRLQIDTSGLETAVDLSSTSRKADHDMDAEPEDSEDEAPLDLKVRPSSSSSPSRDTHKSRFTEIPEFRMDPNLPGPHQRAELLRIAELYTSGPNTNSSVRESSQERDLAFPSDSACSICGADTQSGDFRANEHGENLCGRGTISCSMCSKTFALWSHYESHKKCHQKLKQRQYPCQTCGKIFTSASNRNMHQRIHKGVRPFQCTPCGVFFRQKAHLQKHQKTQGHMQATDIYEKKKKEGLVHDDDDDESNQADEILAPRRGPHPRQLSDGEKESLRSEDYLSNSGSSSAYSESHHVFAESRQNGSPSPMSTTTLHSSGGRSRHKSSPKRKIAKPQQVFSSEVHHDDHDADVDVGDDSDEHPHETVTRAAADTSDDKVTALVDYNDLSHGYDCNQCIFASHDLSVIKDHVRDEHLNASGGRIKCDDCELTFAGEFHLRVHARKHEAGGQYLPCDRCDQVFKVPNKLLKHLEAVHCVCANCGDRAEDRASLIKHLEDVHDEQRLSRGFHASLLQFGPLAHLTSKQSTSTPYSLENRAAKMRKVDSLAETIRQKKQQLTNNNMMPMNGNAKMPPAMTPPRKRKCEIPASTQHNANYRPYSTTDNSRNEFITSLLQLQPQPMSQLAHAKMSPIPVDLLGRSENNNVLSMAGLKLPPSVRLPTRPVSGMTPPSSPTPPPTYHGHIRSDLPRIHGEVSVTIVRHTDDDSGAGDDESDQEETTGLDLSIGKSRRSDDSHRSTTGDEHEVSSSETAGSVGSTELYSRLPFATSNPFLSSSNFPFFTGMIPTPPTSVEKSIAEQLLKLTTAVTGLPRPTVTVSSTPPVITSIPIPSDLKSPPPPTSSLSGPYSVLSAMLGHAPYQPAFPGMAPGMLPTTPVPQNASTMEAEKSPQNLVRSNISEPGKPFSCSYCKKDFSHLSSLESHMEHLHSGEAKHVCESCGKNFSSKSNLTAHKKIHSGERPFECNICHKRFRQKAHLQKHETTHSSATPYQCTVCDKAFGHPSNLNTHMATHSTVRPYHCTDCGKSYKDAASFKRHRLGHTGERPYSCSLCSETFIDSKALRRHREVVHPTAPPHDGDLDSVGDSDVDDDDVSVGRDGEVDDGVHTSQTLDEEDEDDDDLQLKSGENQKNASSSAYSSFDSNNDLEERGSEGSAS